MRVLVYGDFVLDRYTRSSSVRNCPEAPAAPVYVIEEDTLRELGCAGNTLKNVCAISSCMDEKVDVFWGGVMGPVVYDHLFSWRDLYRSTNLYSVADRDIVKQRLVTDDGRILCRLDTPGSYMWGAEPAQVPVILPSPRFDLAIISDYGFGAVNAEVFERISSISDIVVVDSKREDLEIFQGATVIKLNEGEYSHQVTRASSSPMLTVELLCHYCVVSVGDRGCHVKTSQRSGRGYRVDSIHHRGVLADREVDVTGCGDTFTAAIGLCLACGYEINDAARAANYLASRVVSKMGPAVPDTIETRSIFGGQI